jgi:CheY-like chemotaxis protein
MEDNIKKILIVEDEADIANVFKKQLELLGGYSVDLAAGGLKGLEMIAQNQYDLIFLDLVMPEIDGIGMLREIRQNPDKYKAAPIMTLTNVTSDEARTEAEKLGVEKFIVKTDTDIEQVVKEFFS